MEVSCGSLNAMVRLSPYVPNRTRSGKCLHPQMLQNTSCSAMFDGDDNNLQLLEIELNLQRADTVSDVSLYFGVVMKT